MTDRASTRDFGETLIELLVTIVVMGIAAAALVGGLLVAVNASLLHKQQVQAERLLRAWAEQAAAVTDAEYPSCSNAGWYSSKAPAAPSGWSFGVTSIRVWDAASGAFVPCGSATDVGIQRARLTVTAPGSGLAGISRALDVSIRRPCAGTSC